MGLIFYSPFSVANIPEGSDYLESDFKNPLTAHSQAMDGRIVGINLGSSGEYFLNIFQGYHLNEDFIK